MYHKTNIKSNVVSFIPQKSRLMRLLRKNVPKKNCGATCFKADVIIPEKETQSEAFNEALQTF